MIDLRNAVKCVIGHLHPNFPRCFLFLFFLFSEIAMAGRGRGVQGPIAILFRFGTIGSVVLNFRIEIDP